jgi:hypothetical protein
MPDLPVVHVTLTRVVVVVAPERATRPVRGASVELGDDGGQHIVVVECARDPVARLVPVELVVDPLVLVVAAVEREARVASQTTYLVAGLRLDLGDEGGWLLGVGGAGEHEVLPDEEAHGVTEVVEGIMLVDAATPDAQHVHVGLRSRTEQRLVAFVFHSTDEGVGGDPVRAAGEDRHTVQHDPEEARPRLLWIGRLIQLQRTYAGPLLMRAQHVAFLN